MRSLLAAATESPIDARVGAAGRKLSWSERRRVRSRVRRGELCPGADDARYALAVAQAGVERHARNGQLGEGILVLLTLAWWAGGITFVQQGTYLLGAAGLALGAWGTWTTWVLIRHLDGPARAAERNRAWLEEHGEATALPPAAPPSGPRRIAGFALLFVFYVVAFGTVSRAIDGHAITPESVIGRGALFGLLMTGIQWYQSRR